MFKVTPIARALAALIIASALSGCGGDKVEPASSPRTTTVDTSAADAQATADAQAAADAKAEADATAAAAAAAVIAADAKAATDAAAAKAATTAAAKAKAAATAKAKAAAAARAKAAAAAAAKAAEPPPVMEVYYENCTAVRAAGADPIRAGDPGYSRKLDRDGDGIACE